MSGSVRPLSTNVIMTPSDSEASQQGGGGMGLNLGFHSYTHTHQHQSRRSTWMKSVNPHVFSWPREETKQGCTAVSRHEWTNNLHTSAYISHRERMSPTNTLRVEAKIPETDMSILGPIKPKLYKWTEFYFNFFMDWEETFQAHSNALRWKRESGWRGVCCGGVMLEGVAPL